MGKIYKNQTAFRLTLKVDVDTSSALTKKIFYVKPDGSEGSWNATTLDSEHIYKDMNAAEVDQSGRWTFWAEITFADNTWAPGEAVKLTVYDKGE